MSVFSWEHRHHVKKNNNEECILPRGFRYNPHQNHAVCWANVVGQAPSNTLVKSLLNERYQLKYENIMAADATLPHSKGVAAWRSYTCFPSREQ